MATFFKSQGYSHHVTSTALQRCQNITRDDSLLVKTPSEKLDRPTVVLTYHPTTKPVAAILTRNWKILEEHYSTDYIFNEQHMSAFRRDKNIRDTLVHSSMSNDEMSGGTTPCRRPRCNTCKHTVNDGSVTGSSGRRYNIRKAFTCTSTHVIYAIGCKRHPGILYVGETERQLADRFREHRREIVIRELTKPVPQHFCAPGHNVSDATITALVQVYGMQNRRVAEQKIVE